MAYNGNKLSLTRSRYQRAGQLLQSRALHDRYGWHRDSQSWTNLTYTGYDDWTLPTIKQLYLLIDFSGVDPSGYSGTDTSGLIPFIDIDYFDFAYGDTNSGERIIDAHYASSTRYVRDAGEALLFGVNFADGGIKGYGMGLAGREKIFSVACVCENDSYGVNDFSDNGDSTITGNATGLMWAQDDNGEAIDWEAALAYAADATIASYDDWRLPSAKELQSIADYSGVFPAMDTSVFHLTELTNVVYDTETGDQIDTQVTYPTYWTSTSNPIVDEDAVEGVNTYAWLLAAGCNPDTAGYDLHGAGSIVFDTKAEAVSDGTDFEVIYHHARLVRDGDVTETPDGDPTTIDPDRVVEFEDGNAGNPGGDPGGQTPDLAAAAEQLGVTEEALREALGEPGQGEPDYAAAAQMLSVTEEALLAALGLSDDDQPPADPQGGDTEVEQPDVGDQATIAGDQTPDRASIAAALGVTEEALQAALGDPNQGRSDFAAIAAKLGVTEEALVAALGLPAEAPPTDGQRPGGGPPSGAP